VLLGEASHGTSEFYRARAAITRRLIERHGFTIVAAEADWPDAALVATTWNVRCPRSSTRTSGSRRRRP
jgi:erythromycin esterase-like protein